MERRQGKEKGAGGEGSKGGEREEGENKNDSDEEIWISRDSEEERGDREDDLGTDTEDEENKLGEAIAREGSRRKRNEGGHQRWNGEEKKG